MNSDFLQRILKSWLDGGWTMIPIALVAFGVYRIAFQLLLHLSRRCPRKISDSELKQWIQRPETAKGPTAEILRYTTTHSGSLDSVSARFSEVTSSELPEVERRLMTMSVYIAAAPLLGLLGTVLGMLTTFQGIASGGGKMADTIAQGISEALITTEMGLLVALPGMVLSYAVRRKRNEFIAFLSHLETLTLRQLRIAGTEGMTQVFRRDTLHLGPQKPKPEAPREPSTPSDSLPTHLQPS
jgi:biopolymer transport protein ExbB